MSTARTVPVTTELDGDELDAEDAWHLARHHGLRRIAVDSFVRFRYGDGFTNSRALALQACLAVVPFLIALTGFAADIDEDRPARVVAASIEALSPGGGSDDALASAVVEGSEETGEVALTFGLAFAFLSMTTAMAQVERGSNRIYGIRRDRKALSKYGRAAVLTAILAVPVGAGFLLLVAGGSIGDAMVDEYAWSDDLHRAWNIVRWPIGLAMLVLTIAVVLDHAPRRRQPALSWLALGASVTVVAEHAHDRWARGVRQSQCVLRQHLRPARRRVRAAVVVAVLRDGSLLRRRGVCPARGAALRRGGAGVRRPGSATRHGRLTTLSSATMAP